MASKGKRSAWDDETLRLPPALERRSVTARPVPPESCGEEWPETFIPAPALTDWLRDTFILGSGPLANDVHQHLVDASIGCLWTNAINLSKQREIVATAEMPNAMAGGWKRARYEFQLREWFGAIPDFLLTFSAPNCLRLNDRGFCALSEHELHHCAQALDRYGVPKFSRDGRPLYAVRGHDVEQFTDVMRRYGPTTADERELLAAANHKPLVAGELVDIACGTCHVARQAA
jgi:Putative phage metallopeptidase